MNYIICFLLPAFCFSFPFPQGVPVQVRGHPKAMVLAYFLWITQEISIYGNTATGLTGVPDSCQFWFANVSWVVRANPTIVTNMSGSPYISGHRITKMSLPCYHISTGLASIQFIGQPNHLLPQEIAASIPKTREQGTRREKILSGLCQLIQVNGKRTT
jgi:hypothetical protein